MEFFVTFSVKKTEQRAYIDRVCKELGLSLDQLAEKMNYKSLKRAHWGEMAMSNARIQNMEDLLRMHRLRQTTPPVGKVPPPVVSESGVVREETPVYGADIASRALAYLPWETIRDTAKDLMSVAPEKVDVAAIRELLAEMDRRIAARTAAESSSSKPPQQSP